MYLHGFIDLSFLIFILEVFSPVLCKEMWTNNLKCHGNYYNGLFMDLEETFENHRMSTINMYTSGTWTSWSVTYQKLLMTKKTITLTFIVRCRILHYTGIGCHMQWLTIFILCVYMYKSTKAQNQKCVWHKKIETISEN